MFVSKDMFRPTIDNVDAVFATIMCVLLQLRAVRSGTLADWRTTRTRRLTLTVQDPLSLSLHTVNATEPPPTPSSVCQLTHALTLSEKLPSDL